MRRIPFRSYKFHFSSAAWPNYKAGLFALFFCWGMQEAYRRRDLIQLKLLHYNMGVFNLSVELFPITDSADALIRCYRLPQNKKTPLWLVFTGALNPPHPGHILGAVMAMRKLKALGYENVHIAIYPSCDDYVSSKADNQNRPFLGINVRARLTRLLVDFMNGLSAEERQAITVFSSDNESNDLLNCNQRDIAMGKQAEFQQTKSVVYLVGEDVFENFRVLYECDQMPCVVVSRVINGLSSGKLMEAQSETVNEVEYYAPGYYRILKNTYEENNCSNMPERNISLMFFSENRTGLKSDETSTRVMEAYEGVYKNGYSD